MARFKGLSGRRWCLGSVFFFDSGLFVTLVGTRSARRFTHPANYRGAMFRNQCHTACNCHNKDDIVAARQLSGENAQRRPTINTGRLSRTVGRSVIAELSYVAVDVGGAAYRDRERLVAQARSPCSAIFRNRGGITSAIPKWPNRDDRARRVASSRA